MNHIESFRLFDLAEMPAIVDQPEWEHIENCKTCGLTFMQFKIIIEGDLAEFSPIVTALVHRRNSARLGPSVVIETTFSA